MFKTLTVTRCSCGAITIEGISNGKEFSNSMSLKTFEELFPNEPIPDPKWSCCNYCVNHYGIDLCGCGSGNPVGKCDEGFEECKAGSTSQNLFEERASFFDLMSF